MKELTLKQIADWCGGKISARFEHLRVSRMQSDSRKVRSGDLFVALKGAKADGHDFAETAINHGAVAALVSRPISEKLPSIEVEDTLRASQRHNNGVELLGYLGNGHIEALAQGHEGSYGTQCGAADAVDRQRAAQQNDQGILQVAHI